MGIISKIGRRSWRVRLLFAGMYTLLTLGGASMVYPFLLMLSGSTKSGMDIRYFDAFPRFLYDQEWMWAKHLEGLFNESVLNMNQAYGTDEVTFVSMAQKSQLENEKELRCPDCGRWFVYTYPTAECPADDPHARHLHTVHCPNRKCQTAFSEPHGEAPGTIYYELMQPPNRKLAEAWTAFTTDWERELRQRQEELQLGDDVVNGNWLTSFIFVPGYMYAPVSRTFTSGQRQLKELLPGFARRHDPAPEAERQLKDYSDILTVNRIVGTEFISWNNIFIIVPINLSRRATPLVNTYGDALGELFCQTPVGLRYYFNVWMYYSGTFLRTIYNHDLDEYNRLNHTDYTAWQQIPLPRRVPAATSPRQREDWERFVRKNLGLEWLRLDPGQATGFHDMLRSKHVDIGRLNQLYQRQYRDFADVPFTTTAPPAGMARTDWLTFVSGFQPPESNEILQASLENIEILDVNFAFQDWLLARYGSLEQAAATLGTPWRRLNEVLAPQMQAHRAYFADHIGQLRREFVFRNYRTVAEYLVFRGRGIINTAIYCTLAILTALLVNPLAAYAMSRYRLPSSYKILLFLMCTMAFPAMVTAIPSFIMLRTFGLLNTFAALILPGMANGYSIFLLKGFFDAQPKELYESAQLDGASEWVLFWQITMSLSKPILAVIALSAFTSAYSNFMFAFVTCQDQKMWTIMVWLYQLQQNSGQAVMYASLVIAAIPTFIIFLFCQNIIMRGIVVPSEK